MKPDEIRSELERLADAADRWRAQPMAIATVTSTWGSAPRPRGSHMLVAEDGSFEGSVSGGCVEGEVLAAAAETIADGSLRRLRFDVAEETAWSASLPCGGEIEVIVQPLRAGGFPPALLDRIMAARAEGDALAIATDLESGESREGEADEPDCFVNRYLPPRRLLIVGAVQIALPLAMFARGLDISATIIDPRDRFRTAERFPGIALDDRWPDEAVAALRPDPATAVVTLSHDPKIDDPALIAALRSPTGYIAALGSTRSHAKRLERLTAAGFTPEDLARIDGPAGIAIGALGPAEIALSIAAGLVQALRR
ncbi:XdhC family protein [Sphingomonas solaris]|uniref:XdhC family protein n=1 Tax=Alterirhizorhabdus solaris TaxID=2529389 RepID=A0A558QV14_9SPHN|nr:XdhC family protein [Sphingomonas solaris]TVV70907.1 XdhC family protein [Sphingomonas solaris]